MRHYFMFYYAISYLVMITIEAVKSASIYKIFCKYLKSLLTSHRTFPSLYIKCLEIYV